MGLFVQISQYCSIFRFFFLNGGEEKQIKSLFESDRVVGQQQSHTHPHRGVWYVRSSPKRL